MLYALIIAALITGTPAIAGTPSNTIPQALNMIHRVHDMQKLADMIKQSNRPHHWHKLVRQRLAHIKAHGAHLNHFTGALAQKSIQNLEQLLSLL